MLINTRLIFFKKKKKTTKSWSFSSLEMPNKPSQNWMASNKNVLFVTVLWENNIWLLEAVHTWDISCRRNQMVAGAGHLRRLFYSPDTWAGTAGGWSKVSFSPCGQGGLLTTWWSQGVRSLTWQLAFPRTSILVDIIRLLMTQLLLHSTAYTE